MAWQGKARQAWHYGAVTISPEAFMGSTPRLMESNTAWGARYARELRAVITRQAAGAPRSLQAHLGPSEIGAACSRQVVAKLAGEPRTNHVSDPWPSVVGTAVHAWLRDAFQAENASKGVLRWLTETAVTPSPLYPGTADLYDAIEAAVVDWKILGPSSLAKVKAPGGPSRRYQVQLLLYGAGFRALGLPVHRVALAACPRAGATLDGMYVWDHPCTPADEALVAEVLGQMAAREEVARMLRAGAIGLRDVPASPDDDECFFCAFYRPQSAHDGGPGCPGTLIPAAR